MLSTPGIGSGLDINGIITQLMAIERQPLARLAEEQVEATAQISAFGSLKSSVSLFKSAMDDLKDVAKFTYAKATSSDIEVLTASADSTAAKGRYAIEVVRLAENHRMAAGTTLADTDTTTVGTSGDTMTIRGTDGDAFTVAIGGKTLAEVRDAINDASDNLGVTASILRDDTGYRLTLSADATGAENAIQAVEYSAAPADPFALYTLNADRDGSGGFTTADLDAVLTLEGAFTVTRSGNAVSDVIDGVTLNLVDTGTIDLEVKRDDAKIAGSVQQMIGVYNEVMKVLGKVRSDILKPERAALNSIEGQFRAIFNSRAGTSSEFAFLAEIGVTTGTDGTLSLNTSVFNNALARDPAGMASLFTDAGNGIASRFAALADTLIGVGGTFDSREQSLRSRTRSLGIERSNLEFRLTQKEAALVKQYSALDSLVASLNTTSSYLTTQLAQIAAVSRSSNGG